MTGRQPPAAALAVIDAAVEDWVRGPDRSPGACTQLLLEYLAASGYRVGVDPALLDQEDT